MKKLIVTLSLAALALSCEKGPEGDRHKDADSDAVSHEMIVLGNQLEDPYSVANMQRALESLYPVKSSRVDVTPTDIYVRFLPKDDEELARLDRLCPMLMDHPLDYDIVRDGDYYHDPEIAEDKITWQYSVVPSGFIMPAGIRYEILDECYIPNEAIMTRADDIDWKAVEREAFVLTGNAAMLPSQTRGDKASYEPTRPSGRIVLVDESCPLGEEEGVRGVKVCVNTFVKFDSAYTDEDGRYELSKSFTTDVRYRLRFENSKGFFLGVNLLLVNASMSALGRHEPSGVDVRVDSGSDRKLFTRCVVNNAAYDYYSHCENDDVAVSAPPRNLRIWLFQGLKPAFAPMFQQGTLLDSELVSKFLGEYKPLLKIFVPDILMGLKGQDDYASIYASTVHLLANASHFMKVGRPYWNKVLTYELKSYLGGLSSIFGAGTEQDAGYCEVAEMWGFYMENSMFRTRYGDDSPSRGTNLWFSPQILLYLGERGLGENKIFGALGSEVNSKESLQAALANSYPEQKTLINQAFERYSY